MNIKKLKDIHNHEITDIAVYQNNSKFAFVGGDKTVLYWDVVSNKLLRKFSVHHSQINCIKFNKDYNELVTDSFD